MTSDETRIQILANWPMSHAKRVTRDNWKNPEYHVIAALRNLRTDTNCPAGKSWPNHVISSISSISLASLFVKNGIACLRKGNRRRRREMSICSKLRPNLSEMEFRIFVRIQKVIWDHLLASKAEIIQK